MPTVARPDVLAATYAAVRALLDARNVPTTLLLPGQTVFRSVPAQYLPKPAAGRPVLRAQAQEALKPRDGATEGRNRFSGPSLNATIPPSGGLYCVLQQQALVNEAMHYARQGGLAQSMPAGSTVAQAALADKCVVRVVLGTSLLVADLSPHNPGTRLFVQKLEQTPGLMDLLARTQYGTRVSLWDRMVDGDDCSVARGIGLAAAHCGFLRGMSVQTVRRSGRSADERGDNLVLFGAALQPVTGVFVDRAYYFSGGGPLEAVPVER